MKGYNAVGLLISILIIVGCSMGLIFAAFSPKTEEIEIPIMKNVTTRAEFNISDATNSSMLPLTSENEDYWT